MILVAPGMDCRGPVAYTSSFPPKWAKKGAHIALCPPQLRCSTSVGQKVLASIISSQILRFIQFAFLVNHN